MLSIRKFQRANLLVETEDGSAALIPWGHYSVALVGGSTPYIRLAYNGLSYVTTDGLAWQSEGENPVAVTVEIL